MTMTTRFSRSRTGSMLWQIIEVCFGRQRAVFDFVTTRVTIAPSDWGGLYFGATGRSRTRSRFTHCALEIHWKCKSRSESKYHYNRCIQSLLITRIMTIGGFSRQTPSFKLTSNLPGRRARFCHFHTTFFRCGFVTHRRHFRF